MSTTTIPSDSAEMTDLTLFEEAEGDVLEGFLLAKARDFNIPPAWFERSRDSRTNRHEAVVAALQSGNWSGIETLRDWNEAYQKECFYYGVRVLLELDRSGKSEW